MDAFCVKKLVFRYPLSMITCAAIWFLSLAPIGEMEIAQDVDISDKWAHFIMYAGFVSVMWAEWLRWQHKSRNQGLLRDVYSWQTAVAMLAMPVAMGGVLELLQAYATTYRSGEWLDVVANSIGVVIGNAVGIGAAHVMAMKAGRR